MRRKRTLLSALALAVAALAVSAAPASASFHLIQIREVYPGSLISPASEYVELQMWAAGQNLVGGHVLRTYDTAGNVTSEDTFAQNLPNGANQSTMVLTTPAAEAAFGFKGDAAIPASDVLDPSGGAVCWESLDCVTWGNFHGNLGQPTGSPAAPTGIADGMALRRSIAPGCATLLEPADDSDNSVADFASVLPGPRPNSVAPSERACGSGGESAPPGGSPPQTRLRKPPPRKSRDRTPTFRFAASESGVAFECALDRHRFRPCGSPFTPRPLSIGRHTFKVRALDAADRPDPSPASYAFRVLPKRCVSGR
jgi:hypothetical protein